MTPVPRDPLLGTATAVLERRLDPELFCKNVRSARHGAAPGPSGMSIEHILGLVESDDDMEIFCNFATIVSQGHVPRGVLGGVRNGTGDCSSQAWWGHSSIVVGDRAHLAQQISKQVEEATTLQTSQDVSARHTWCRS